jgi:hypothetical protein
MSECKTGLCPYVRILGGIAVALLAGTALFFSCGKADDKQADDGGKKEDVDDVEIHLTFEAYTDTDVEAFRVYAGT